MKEAKPQKESWRKIVPHTTPIYQTSVYNYPDLDTIDDYYNGLIPGGYLYSRNGLPNSDELGRLVAGFEGAEAGVVCSSGMAALLVALCSNLKSGDRVVASSDLYGGTIVLLRDELARFGIATRFVDAGSLNEVRDAIVETKPRIVVIETISNPMMKVPEIRQISKLSHASGATLLADNTFATPFVARPLELGADIVMHSGTKFLGGHGDLTIGVLCGRKGEMKKAAQFSTHAGTLAGPFDCWLASRSASTWRVRVEKSSENALRLARYLERRRDKVAKVYYPGLESYPHHKTAKAMFQKGLFGAMLSFDIRGGLKEVNSFVNRLRRVTLTPSLGGVATTISHPGKTSHRNIGEQERKKVGITDAMIRVSVGIEEYPEIESDFEAALV
jgi:cystathionine gamma-synthase